MQLVNCKIINLNSFLMLKATATVLATLPESAVAGDVTNNAQSVGTDWQNDVTIIGMSCQCHYAHLLRQQKIRRIHNLQKSTTFIWQIQ